MLTPTFRQRARWTRAPPRPRQRTSSTASRPSTTPPRSSLANNLAPFGIRVNCVAPGSIEFPGGMWETIKNVAPAQYEAIQNSIPFGRLGTPEEVANAVIFLASERASWISGVTLSVDGVQHKGNL